ncbi:MAG: exonuclease [Elusimicrobia bacterium HGW-Elusimicrobia-1]|jgi:DNA polymerase-3 subunit epsilon|nr:MAG: exonuclease [Elusimicrobia bacterium HGW-Elusimicrobia-1]
MSKKQIVKSSRPPVFAAIDFETADYWHDSACSVAVVRVEDNKIVERVHHYIRPPRQEFVFTHVHGITWEDVVDAPKFSQIWPDLHKVISGVEFLAAHNAPFDRAVLDKCCSKANFKLPDVPFQCTMRLAREIWGLRPTKLSDVCAHLDIPLQHHNAKSDAEACAKIVIAAMKAGASLS